MNFFGEALEEELTKEDIIKSLKKCRREITTVINGLASLDKTDDRGLNRVLVQGIVFTLSSCFNNLANAEIDLHNFMKRRG